MFGKIADIFRKREVLLPPADLGVLKVDVHSHFIPGIDDGADSMETSLELIGKMAEFGYKKVVTTPHVMSDYYRNTPDIIRSGCDKVREALSKAGIDIEIDCAAEYYLDAELMDKVKKRELLTFGDNYVLFELPFLNEPPNLANVVFEMQLAGYKPVLAHPERYAFWHMDFDKYETMIDKGVLLQLNINSLTGHYSPIVKKIAQQLIEKGMIELLGSDCHHAGHIELMNHARQLEPLHAVLKSGKLKNNQL
ncbi:MAG: CpsB/CapC family capsule biosynthesis tyrosine phosphatase [Flavobacteriales bacterium]